MKISSKIPAIKTAHFKALSLPSKLKIARYEST
jgi:hypothetical protein